MATQKGCNMKMLNSHVLVYTSLIGLAAFFIFSWKAALAYTLLNGIMHWITDFFTSRLILKYKAQPKIFFGVLGFDQFIHYTSLYLTLTHWSEIQALIF